MLRGEPRVGAGELFQELLIFGSTPAPGMGLSFALVLFFESVGNKECVPSLLVDALRFLR